MTRLGAKLLDLLDLPAGTALGLRFAGFRVTATAAATVHCYLLEKPPSCSRTDSASHG